MTHSADSIFLAFLIGMPGFRQPDVHWGWWKDPPEAPKDHDSAEAFHNILCPFVAYSPWCFYRSWLCARPHLQRLIRHQQVCRSEQAGQFSRTAKCMAMARSSPLPDANTERWYTATVPATVLAVQVAAGEFKDPFVGTNLRSIPGTSYPQGDNFSNIDMPADSPYHCGWWYRKAFHVAASERGKTFLIHFGGINYRADIWLNGQKIADSTQVQGAYRTYEFDVTKMLKPGHENVLAVETFAPTPTDLGINWVDWNPCPPDKDMDFGDRSH